MNNIYKIERLRKELDSLRPISSEQEKRIMQKFRLDWNYHSNNKREDALSYSEVKALILHSLTASGKPLRLHYEVRGHNKAIKWIEKLVLENEDISEEMIKKLHTYLLKESYEVEALSNDGTPIKRKVQIGKYKNVPNRVKTRTGETFHFSSPDETPQRMQELVAWYKDKALKKKYNPIILAAEFHYKLLCIHPFDDGNGRTARLLMNFILMKAGYPPIIFKREERINYLLAIQQADGGHFQALLDFVSMNLIRSLEFYIRAARGGEIEEFIDLDLEIARLEKKLALVTLPPKVKPRNKEIMLKVYDFTVVPLLTKFINNSLKYSKFYSELKISPTSNNLNKFVSLEDSIDTGRKQIDVKNEYFIMKCEYRKFKTSKIELYFISSIYFSFQPTLYKVYNGNKEIVFEKFYTENLKEEEIELLVMSEMKRHKDEIEKKINLITS